MFTKINKLVTRAQMRIIRRAARILVNSDQHDACFFNELQALTGITDNVIRIGDSYAVVREKEPATKQLVQVKEVTKYGSEEIR